MAQSESESCFVEHKMSLHISLHRIAKATAAHTEGTDGPFSHIAIEARDGSHIDLYFDGGRESEVDAVAAAINACVSVREKEAA